MIQDTKKQDGFLELLKLQEATEIPDFLEAAIMNKIQAVPQKKGFMISLQSVFIISILASAFMLLAVLSAYYYPQYALLQDAKMILLLSILVKLLYDINDLLPNLLPKKVFFKKSH